MAEIDEHGRVKALGHTPLNSTIRLDDYSSEWPARFQQEAARIRRALGSKAVLVEHVGSTSVPGLAAKPIIDVVLAVPDTTDEDAYVLQLVAEGFVLRHREPDWYQHRMFKRGDDEVHLHVFSARCPEIDRMLLFRNWLRNNAADRQLYEQTKRDLAVRVWEYMQNYADAKAAVVQEIMRRAEAESKSRAESR